MAIDREALRARRDARRDALRERAKKIRIHHEFKDFLKEYKVVGLAIAFIMGAAATTLIKSLVDNIVMPLITIFIPGGGWQTATIHIGKAIISWGPFVSASINFLIIAIVIFIVVKYLIREEKEEKKEEKKEAEKKEEKK